MEIIDQFNKKRKWITIYSLSITIVIVALLVVLNVYFKNIFVVLGSIVLFIALLYFQSKVLIMPLYNDLSLKIIKYSLDYKYSSYSFKKAKKVEDKFYYIFNKDKTTISNNISIVKENEIIHFYDFTCTISKNENVYGRVIEYEDISILLDDQCYVSSNKNLSEHFINYYKDKYSNHNDYVTSLKKNRRYESFYTYKMNLELLNVLEDISMFNCIRVTNNKITIIYLDKEDGFNFKLQNKFQNDLIVYCKDKYQTQIKMVEKIRQLCRK